MIDFLIPTNYIMKIIRDFVTESNSCRMKKRELCVECP